MELRKFVDFLRCFVRGVAEKLVGRILGFRACRHRLHVGRLKASGRVRELHKLLLEALGSSWSFQKHDASALSVSGRLGSHDLSFLSVFGGLPGGHGSVWPPCDGRAAHLIVGGLGPPKAT